MPEKILHEKAVVGNLLLEWNSIMFFYSHSHTADVFMSLSHAPP